MIAMTHDDVDKAARLRGDIRWNIWRTCGVHNWQTLPHTDSGEHYCPNCYTMRTHAGVMREHA